MSYMSVAGPIHPATPRMSMSTIPPSPRPGNAVAAQGATFKAPAHKHAHHLHSIPPREKSTRTLILDHMLCVHARTRLQQARAELGMSFGSTILDDKDVNKSVERLGREDDVFGDFEDVTALKFSSQPDIQMGADEQHYESQDLALAHALRLKADGVERVLTAMVNQPPHVQPPLSDEDTSRAILPYGTQDNPFPNGVRFRLALSTLVNDLFARDAPTPLSPTLVGSQDSKQKGPPPSYASASGKSILNTSGSQRARGRESVDFVKTEGLPPCALPMASISNYSLSGPESPNASSGLWQGSSASDERSTSQPWMSSPQSAQTFSNAYSPTSRRMPNPTFARLHTTERVQEMYLAGADPSTANSPPSLRCPRHLHHACNVCAPVHHSSLPSSYNSHTPSGSSPASSRSATGSGSLGHKSRSKDQNGSSALAPWKAGAGIGAGLAAPGIQGSPLRRRTIAYYTTPHPKIKDAGPCSSAGKLAELIPRFLRLSALVAMELGREARDKDDASDSTAERRTDAEERDNRQELVFIRHPLSSIPPSPPPNTYGTTRPGRSSTLTGGGQPVFTNRFSDSTSETVNISFKPTQEWYAILVGLLTRAVLEGYLSRGWKGPDGMECLLGLGLGMVSASSSTSRNGSEAIDNEDSTHRDASTDEYGHMDPDDFPSLLTAAEVLFPSLRPSDDVGNSVPNQQQPARKEGAEAEYEAVMLTRVKDFITVPPATHDLSTHLEDLAYKYPAEPVERAAVRFCEAVARWRGKPELESYRKTAPQKDTMQVDQTAVLPYPSTSGPSAPTPTASTSVFQLPVNPVSQPTKAHIETYFLPPPSLMDSRDSRYQWYASKRKRSTAGLRDDRSNVDGSPTNRQKRSNAGPHDMNGGTTTDTHRQTEDWTGPYGV